MSRGRRVLSVLRREIGAVVGLSFVVIPVGLTTSFCLLGVPLTAWGLAHLTKTTLRAAQGARGVAERTVSDGVWRIGAYAYVGVVAVIAGSVFAVTVASHLLGDVPSTTLVAVGAPVALAASAAIGAALAPLSFAPWLAADGVDGFVRPLLRSFELASRAGAARTAAVGALAGLAIALSLLLVVLLFAMGMPDADTPSGALIAAPFGIIPGPPIAAALWADAYVEAKEGVRSRADLDVRVGARLKTALGLLVPVAVALTAALVAAAATPTSMRPLDPGVSVSGARISAEPPELQIHGGYVTVRGGAHGVVVEAYDGGGAGSIDAGFDTRQSGLALRPGPEHGGPPGSLAVVVITDEASAFTVLDEDGVRLDDGLTDRVFGRLGILGLIALLAGSAFSLLLLFVVGAELGEARGLSAPALLDPDAVRRGGLAALPGTLRLGEGARARYRPASTLSRLLRGAASRLVVEGDGWVEAEAGALRFRLPEAPTPVLRGGDVEDWDGQTVVLLSRFASASPTGLRDAWTSWPADGRLVLGEVRDAAHSLVARTARGGSFLAVPALAAWGFATVRLLSAL